MSNFLIEIRQIYSGKDTNIDFGKFYSNKTNWYCNLSENQFFRSRFTKNQASIPSINSEKNGDEFYDK